MGDTHYSSGQGHPTDGNNQHWEGNKPNTQFQGQYAQQVPFQHGAPVQQNFGGELVYPSQYFGPQGTYQPAGAHFAPSETAGGFMPSGPPADVSYADGGLPMPPQAILPSNGTVQNQNRFLAGYDPQFVPQFGEVTRRAFTRRTGEGKEEYDPSMPRAEGDTIPDPLSVEEGGRTYQNYREGQYFLPNDAIEQDRSARLFTMESNDLHKC